jgi:hypothetical protein
VKSTQNGVVHVQNTVKKIQSIFLLIGVLKTYLIPLEVGLFLACKKASAKQAIFPV